MVMVKATMDIERNDDFIEFKVESDQAGEQTTDQINGTGHIEKSWDMGNSAQNIWYWWDTLKGKAQLSVSVDGTELFRGECAGGGDGEKRVVTTCANPQVYKTAGSPRVEEGPDPITYIRW